MSSIEFSVNGKKHSVDSCEERDMTLNSYLRRALGLPGTKYMCQEGGCGACIVMVKAKRPTSGEIEVFHVNSCLVLIFSCNGWDITTVEAIGNRLAGYSDVQKRIVEFNATQCGYCTPGWVMAITSLLNKNLTMAELEQSFGSNTCRCTGYRPLLDAIKSFAVDASPQLCQRVRDIQDIEDTAICERTKQPCGGICPTEALSEELDWVILDTNADPNIIDINFGNSKHFYKVFNTSDIFEVMNRNRNLPYMLADGNTAKGIYPILEYPPIVIDISDVTSLKKYYFDQNLVLGGNVALEDCIGIFRNVSKTKTEFQYLSKFADHLLLVAHIPVRKIGSLAGNLMIKHKHHEYQSDVFLLFESVGATVTVSKGDVNKSLTLTDFLNFDMNGWLITYFKLPPSNTSHVFNSYKIMPRNQNALAILNAAFYVKLENNIIEEASLVLGNISPSFIHATKTEKFIQGKNIFENETLQQALKMLKAEVQPEDKPPQPSPATRQKIALGLFYKFILSIAPPSLLKSEYRSGGKMLERPVSTGTQDYETHPDLYPRNQPLPKLEAVIQSSGEATYINDLPPIRNEIFAAFVLSTVYNGQVDKIDATEVLNHDGVLAVYTAKDIPGKNSFVAVGVAFVIEDEVLLADQKIEYYGQPVAILVAKTEELAKTMAEKVLVTYKNVSTKPPVLTIDAAKKDSNRIIPSDSNITPTRRGTDIKRVIKGVYNLPGQYHYYMEPISTVVVPVDYGVEVYPSTQFPELEQLAIAQVLGIKDSEVFLKVRRIGGGFGGKITRCARVSTACALVAKKLNLPCRFIMPLKTSMLTNGTRYPSQCAYEVGVNESGEMQYLQANLIADSGCSTNEDPLPFISGAFANCYDKSIIDLKCSRVYTDKPSNINARAPGTSQAIATIENIMEHIAFDLKKDPTDVRLANIAKDNADIPQLIEFLKNKADYDKRAADIKLYNASNRWMKKALQINVMVFPISYINTYSTMVSIYRGDGTVTVTSGGVEMGQGINTKVAQVVAYELKIPVDKVSVLPIFSFVAPQNMASGGSITSDCISFAAIKACEQLNARLAPVKADMPDASWKEIVFEACSREIDLTERYTMTDKDLTPYNAYVVAMSEVTLDVLTGRFMIDRVDIVEDVGLSTNPNIDVGQVEGAYIQGVGYLTCEDLVFDEASGKLLTNRSLTYHVPLCTDIPVKLNVHLRYNSYNNVGVLGAKAVGEMGVCAANGVTISLRYAIQDSRKASGYDAGQWIDISIPCTTESILSALDVKIEELLLN